MRLWLSSQREGICDFQDQDCIPTPRWAHGHSQVELRPQQPTRVRARCPKELGHCLDGHGGCKGWERWRGVGRARQRDGQNCVLPALKLGAMPFAGEGAVEQKDHAEAAGNRAFSSQVLCHPAAVT